MCTYILIFRTNTSKILEDNVKFRSRLLDDDSDPMKLRPAQSVLHFRCHDVNVNIDGALWAYRSYRVSAFFEVQLVFCMFCLLGSRGVLWPHVTSDGTAFINVTGATISLEFDVRVNAKGTFEFFLLHNQVFVFTGFCGLCNLFQPQTFGHQVDLGQLGLKLVSGYGSTASWFFGIFVAVMRTNVQVAPERVCLHFSLEALLCNTAASCLRRKL